jgi:hypothetical protein
MNHDIVHCIGTDCPKKDKCYRFRALQDINKPIYINIMNSESCIKINYKLFYSYEN